MAEKSKIEEVARAIWREREKQFPERVRRPEPDTFDNASGAWDMVLDLARAAIQAMREPTASMSMKGLVQSERDDIDLTPEEVDDIWGAMIDAALSEQVAG